MSRRSIAPGAQSRFGLPKNFVDTEAPAGTPKGALTWLRTRDDFDGMLFDTLDALHAGLIDRRTFDAEKARLMVARRKADSRFEHAVRQALRPPSTSKMRRPR